MVKLDAINREKQYYYRGELLIQDRFTALVDPRENPDALVIDLKTAEILRLTNNRRRPKLKVTKVIDKKEQELIKHLITYRDLPLDIWDLAIKMYPANFRSNLSKVYARLLQARKLFSTKGESSFFHRQPNDHYVLTDTEPPQSIEDYNRMLNVKN